MSSLPFGPRALVAATSRLLGRASAGAGLHEDLTAAQVRTILGLDAGPWTPTLTAVANCDSVSLNGKTPRFMRVNDHVTCNGYVQVDVTLTATTTTFGMSLPVASDLAADDLWGLGHYWGSQLDHTIIEADAANNRANFTLFSSGTGVHPIFFEFMYPIK